MTPTVKAASKLVADPAASMWFDIGQQPEYSTIDPLDCEALMRLPFDRCTLCGNDADGHLFLLTLIAGSNSVAVAGLTKTPRGIVETPGFAYVATEAGIGTIRVTDKASSSVAVVVIDRFLKSLKTTGCAAYGAAPVENTINRMRLSKGKRALSYNWRTVVVAPRKPHGPGLGGTHASPRQHDRRGHWRTHPSGKQVWVKACKVGKAADGSVFKDYRVMT